MENKFVKPFLNQHFMVLPSANEGFVCFLLFMSIQMIFFMLKQYNTDVCTISFQNYAVRGIRLRPGSVLVFNY